MQAPLIPAPKKMTIDLFGLLGSFSVPNKQVRVNYFSTKASSRDRSAGDFGLLRELKPMRERVAPHKLRNLNSLLQRDLNDARVALELVPYLNGFRSEIAFFPAILAVLLPTDFIVDDGVLYPKPTLQLSGDHQVSDYGGYWTVTAFKAGDNHGPLGGLSIDSSKTSVIVLDGQHRANAFRFVCGLMDQEGNSIHSAFYSDAQIPENFEAELPVTLIWFEGSDVKPTLISRNLFVDVNNTARKVSHSRNILLDDKEVTSLLTRFFYSSVAADSSFEPSKFSLLHGAFDIDSDLCSKSGTILSLTNPEIIEYVMSCLLFDWGYFNAPQIYKVQREKSKKTPVTFEQVFKGERFNRSHIFLDDHTETFEISDTRKIEDFEKEFAERLLPTFNLIFNGFELFRQHYKACETVAEWRKHTGSSMERQAWDSVFAGGEGLYYTLVYADSLASSFDGNKRVQDLRKAVQEIEQRFGRERAALFPTHNSNLVDQAFTSVRSKAFQVGLFMGLKVFADEQNFEDVVDEYISRLNQLTPSNWITVLTQIKPQLISGVDPKAWPAYQKLILRIIQKDEEYYDSAKFLISPDGKIFAHRIENKFASWLDSGGVDASKITADAVSHSLLKSWAEESKQFVDELFKGAGIKLIENVESISLAKNVIEESLSQ